MVKMAIASISMLLRSPSPASALIMPEDHFSFVASTASKVSNSSGHRLGNDTSKAVRRLFATRGDLLQAPGTSVHSVGYRKKMQNIIFVQSGLQV